MLLLLPPEPHVTYRMVALFWVSSNTRSHWYIRDLHSESRLGCGFRSSRPTPSVLSLSISSRNLSGRLLEWHRSVRCCRVSHASLHVYKSEDRRLCILAVFVAYQSVILKPASCPDSTSSGLVQVSYLPESCQIALRLDVTQFLGYPPRFALVLLE